MPTAYLQKERHVNDDMRRTLDAGGFDSYIAKLDGYKIPELLALFGLLSDGPSRLQIVRCLYDHNSPLTACELRKKLNPALRVNPLDMPWISRHYYTPERKLEAKYDGRMVDYRALLRAKVQLVDIERKADRVIRRRINEKYTRKGRGRVRPLHLMPLPLLR